MLWADNVFDAAMIAETDLSLYLAIANGGGANAEFVNVGLPQVRLFSSKKNDGLTSTVRDYTFTAGPQAAAAIGKVQGTLFIQDSLAP